MNILPVLLPFLFALFLSVFHRRFERRYIFTVFVILIFFITILSWLIAMDPAGGESFSYPWINLLDFSVSLSINWGLETAFISAVATTTFLALLLFFTRDITLRDNWLARFFSLCLTVFFFEVLIASPNAEQILFGWQGMIIATSILFGFSGERSERAMRPALFALTIQMTAILLFIAFIQMSNVLHVAAGHAASLNAIVPVVYSNFKTSLNALFYVFVCIIAVPLGIFPFNIWMCGIPRKSMASFGCVVFFSLLAGTYVTYYIFSQATVSQDVRLFMGILAAVNLVVMALNVFRHNNLHKITLCMCASSASSIFFFFAFFPVDDALIFAVVQCVIILGFVLNAGAVVTMLSGETNINNMGGLRKRMKAQYYLFACSVFCLLFVPLFSVFFVDPGSFGMVRTQSVTIVVMVIGYFILACALGRILHLIFHGKENLDERVLAHIASLDIPVVGSLIILLVLPLLMLLFVGYFSSKNVFVLKTFIDHIFTIWLWIPIVVVGFGLFFGFKTNVLRQKGIDTINTDMDIERAQGIRDLFFFEEALLLVTYKPLWYLGRFLYVLETPIRGIAVHKRKIVALMTRLCSLFDRLYILPNKHPLSLWVITIALVSLLLFVEGKGG